MRCQPCACPITSLSANLRISSRIDFERIVESAAADRSAVVVAHQLDEFRPPFRGVAACYQLFDRGFNARRHLGQLRPRSAGRTIWFCSSECPDDLREIFAEPDADEMLFDFSEQATLGHAFGIGGELTHRLDVGSEPGEPVRGPLLAIQQAVLGVAFRPTTRSRTLRMASSSSASSAVTAERESSAIDRRQGVGMGRSA